MNYDEAEGIRRSDLWVINKSPMHFKHHMETPKPVTDALRFGAAAHKYILEPDAFYDAYMIAPDVNRRTKDGREEWSEFIEFCNAKSLAWITLEEFETIRDMENAVRRNKTAAMLLDGDHEREFYWLDDMTLEPCKCKVDCLTTYDSRPYIVDYKTADSCEDGRFERAARKYGYQFQAGMYCEGLFQNTLTEYGFAFVAQEKTPPYAVRVYVCDREWINRGYDKFRELIGIYHECKQTGNWYSYGGPDEMPVELVEE